MEPLVIPEPQLSPSTSRPRPRNRLLLFLVSITFIIAGIWLLKEFLEQPMGSIPGMPGTWRGAPLLLGACFLTIYGALIVILRRFSLAAILATGILSAGFATGMQAYAKSIRHIATDSCWIDIENSDEFSQKLHQSLSNANLASFADRLVQDKFVQFNEYDSISIRVSSAREGTLVDIRYTYCPCVHTGRSELRGIVKAYVEFAAACKAGEIRQDQGFRRYTDRWSAAKDLAIKLVDSGVINGANYDDKGMQAFVWLAQHVTDEDLCGYLESQLDTIKKLKGIKE